MPQSPNQQWQLKSVTLQLPQDVCNGMSGKSLQWVHLFLDVLSLDTGLCLQLNIIDIY